jgi:hypothetical protein
MDVMDQSADNVLFADHDSDVSSGEGAPLLSAQFTPQQVAALRSEFPAIKDLTQQGGSGFLAPSVRAVFAKMTEAPSKCECPLLALVESLHIMLLHAHECRLRALSALRFRALPKISPHSFRSPRCVLACLHCTQLASGGCVFLFVISRR